MKNIKKYIALFVCALALVASAGVSRTNAYFTAHTLAEGYLKVSAKTVRTIPNEEHDGANKKITVENTGESDCWVRVKVVYPDSITVNVHPVIANDPNWINVGDYWYYTKILPAAPEGGTSVTDTAIKADVTVPDGELQAVLEHFNVVVVTECIPVLDYEATQPPINAEGWGEEFEIVTEG